jgi:trehalose 2-sulfotransferase
MPLWPVAKLSVSNAPGMTNFRMLTMDTRSTNEPWLVWAICTIARSGSSWLSQLVASTQLLGNPEEYMLHWPQRCVHLGLSRSTPLEEYVSCLIRQRSTPNGVFSIKGSFAELQPFLELFPHAPCVWLSRENKLEQAVSWHRAHDGGLWSRTDAARPEPLFEFSSDRALWFYDEILRREALWRAFFSSREAKPLLLSYEAVCRDPLGTVRSIATYVGVDPDGIEQVTSSLRVVRDEQSARLVELTQQALWNRSVSAPIRPSPAGGFN